MFPHLQESAMKHEKKWFYLSFSLVIGLWGTRENGILGVTPELYSIFQIIFKHFFPPCV